VNFRYQMLDLVGIRNCPSEGKEQVQVTTSIIIIIMKQVHASARVTIVWKGVYNAWCSISPVRNTSKERRR